MLETHRMLTAQRRQKLKRPMQSQELLWQWYSEEDENIVLVLHGPKKEGDPLHVHDYFILHYMFEGECEFRLMEETLHLRQGDICILRPEIPHAIASCDHTQKIFCCLVHPRLLYYSFLPLVSDYGVFVDFFLQYLTNKSGRAYLQFCPEGQDGDSVREVFAMMMEEYAEKPPAYRSILKCQLALLLGYLSRGSAISGAAEKRNGCSTSAEIVNYIAEHYATATLESTAKHFNYNPNYLTTRLRRETGKTFSGHQTEFLLLEAASLLLKRTLSISDIAQLIGYSNTGHFYRAFERYYGMTPRNYVREQTAKDNKNQPPNTST